jgi:hypothetical protein
MPSIDIEIDDFYWECSSRDKRWLVDELKRDGYLEGTGLCVPEDIAPMDMEWTEVLQKLLDGRIQLTLEQEDLIRSIAKGIV